MISSTTTARVDVPAAEAITFLADGRNETAWRYDVVSSTLVRGEPGRPGAVYAQTMEPGRREVQGGLEVLEVAPRTVVRWRSIETTPSAFSGTYAARPLGERSMRPYLRRVGRRYADDLRTALAARPAQSGRAT